MPAATSKDELYAALRRDLRAGMSQRAIQTKHEVGRRTVMAAESSAWPEQREKPDRRASRLDAHEPMNDAWLVADLDAPREQRHTVTRIYGRLLDEQARTGVSYSVVRRDVVERRPQVRVEAGCGPAEVFIPKSYRPRA